MDQDLLKLDEGTYLQQGGSIRTWEYFSRYTVAANTTTARLFVSQQGQPGFTRLDQTNMPATGRIPNSQRFDISAISIGYDATVAKNDANSIAIVSWLFTTVLSFYIQDKTVMFQKRLSSILGIGLYLFNDPTTTAEPVNNPIRTSLAKTFNLKRVIKLAANTDFWVEITPGVAAGAQQATDVDILDVGLHGDLWARV